MKSKVMPETGESKVSTLYPIMYNFFDDLGIEKSSEEVVLKVRKAYEIAVEYYAGGKLQQAGSEFVKVIRPALSKPTMKKILLDDLRKEDPETLKILLDSMYYLGLIYQRDGINHENNYTKAAAIFQYCAAFAKKHKIGDVKFYLKQAYAVEQRFLVQNPDLEISEKDFEDYKTDLAKYKARLDSAKDSVKSDLDSLQDFTLKDIDIRSTTIEEIYRDSSSIFVNDKQNGVLQNLLSECYERLGPISTGCEFAIIGLGSLAIGTMTPWSDIEFGILINEDKPEFKEYFRKLTKLLHIKIINLGETPLRSVGVESLNDFRTAKDEDDWFWDDVIESGLSFDGTQWHACKSPLGRKGYKGEQKVKKDSAINDTIILDKPDYELILTPEQMAEFQGEKADSWWSTDRHLVQSLKRTSLIDGSQSLLDKYRYLVHQAAVLQTFRARELEILQEDLEKFSLKLGDEAEGKLIDVKKDIYRLGDRILVSLANYYGIGAEEGERSITIWEITRKMSGKILSTDGTEHLRQAISIATELRLRTYLHNDGQIDGMSTYEVVVEHLDEEQRVLLREKTFYIKDTSILYHFYYVMLRVQEVINVFCDNTAHEFGKLVLNLIPLYDASSYNKGMVHARFLEYKKAMEYMEIAVQETPKDVRMIESLFFLCSKLSEIDRAIKFAQEILQIQVEKDEMINYHNISIAFNNLGNAYYQKGVHEKAFEYFNLALRIELGAYKDIANTPHAADIYCNLAMICRRRGTYDSALEHYHKALEIYKIVYILNPNHPHIAACYNNLGTVYYQIDDFQQSIICYNKALAVKLAIHKFHPNHPDIASTYENIALLYSQKGEYNKAIQVFKHAITMFLTIYSHYPNESIALAYHNLGSAYYENGDYGDAVENCNKALDIMITIHGSYSNNAAIADIYNNLGNIYDSIGSYSKAIECYEYALRIRFEIHKENPNHQSIAMIYNNLGLAYSNEMLYDQAIESYNKALKIFENIPYYKYDVISAIYNNLGMIYASNNEDDKAIEYYHKSLNVKKLYGFDHPKLSSTYNNLGLIYVKKQEYEKAIEYYNKSLEIKLKWYRASHPDTEETYNNLSIAKQWILIKDFVSFKLKSAESQQYLVDKKLNVSVSHANLTKKQVLDYCHNLLDLEVVFSFEDGLGNINLIPVLKISGIDTYLPHGIAENISNPEVDKKITALDLSHAEGNVNTPESNIVLEKRGAEAVDSLTFIQNYVNDLSTLALQDARDGKVVDALVKCFKTFQIYQCILPRETSNYELATTNLGCIFLLTDNIREYQKFLFSRKQNPESALILLFTAMTNRGIEELPSFDLTRTIGEVDCDVTTLGDNSQDSE